MTGRRAFKVTVIALVNVVFFTVLARWLYHNINFKLVLYDISHVSRLSILSATTLGVLLYGIYGVRMAKLMDLTVLTSTQIVVMGFGFNGLLPFRLGDVLKIFCAKQFFKVDLTRVTFASVVEKLFDVMVLTTLGAVFVFHGVTHLFWVALLMLLGLVVLLRFQKTIAGWHPLFEKITAMMQEVLAKHKIFSLSVTTLSIWIITTAMFMIYFRLNVDQFALIDGISLVVLATLSLSIPSMPAGLGLFESGMVYYLTQYLHVNSEQAVAYAVVYHLCVIVPQIVCALLILLLNLRRSTQLEPSYS